MLRYRTALSVALVSFTLASCSMPSQLLILKNDGEFIEYTGSATLSGLYFSDPSNLETQQLVCFLPDRSSQKLLPQDSYVNPFHWMCFSNSTEAKGLLGLDSVPDLDSACYKGSAMITIRNYHRYIAESEGVSYSKLTSVHRHDAASAVPCPYVWQSGSS